MKQRPLVAEHRRLGVSELQCEPVRRTRLLIPTQVRSSYRTGTDQDRGPGVCRARAGRGTAAAPWRRASFSSASCPDGLLVRLQGAPQVGVLLPQPRQFRLHVPACLLAGHRADQLRGHAVPRTFQAPPRALPQTCPTTPRSMALCDLYGCLRPKMSQAAHPLQTRRVRRRWFGEPKKEIGRAAVGAAQMTCANERIQRAAGAVVGSAEGDALGGPLVRSPGSIPARFPTPGAGGEMGSISSEGHHGAVWPAWAPPSGPCAPPPASNMRYARQAALVSWR